MQRPRRGDGRVLLPQRTGSRIARIGEYLSAGRCLPLVEREEVGLLHIDLAAHLADRGKVAALELLRHVLERADIGGDVLAFGAVAPRRGAHQFAVLVAQRHRQAVDLRLGQEGDRLVVCEFQEATDALDEIDHVLLAERIVQRQHRHRMPHLGETARRRGADGERQAALGDEIREFLLDGVVAPAQRIVFGVGDSWRIVLIVALVVLGDLRLQPRMLALCLPRRHRVDIERFVVTRHGVSRRRT